MQPGKGMTIDMNTLPIKKCGNCQSVVFVPTYNLRYCSAIQSPVGKAGLIYIQTGFECADCKMQVDMKEKPPENTVASPQNNEDCVQTTAQGASVIDLSQFKKKE